MHFSAFHGAVTELKVRQRSTDDHDTRPTQDAMKVRTCTSTENKNLDIDFAKKKNGALLRSRWRMDLCLTFTITAPVEPTENVDHDCPSTQTIVTMNSKTLALLDSALCSLYKDQIFPTFSALQPRLRDFKLPQDVQDNFVRIYGNLPAYIVDEHVEPPSILFAHEPDWFANWVEPTSKEDPYPDSLWQGFTTFLQGLPDRDIGSCDDDVSIMVHRDRHGMAHDLVSRKLPFFEGITLGQINHIVELAIGRKLLAYENNMLLPASCCMSHTAPGNAD